MYEAVFQTMDEINKRWKELEGLVAKLPLKVKHLKLCVRRYPEEVGQMRLCYGDRPVVDCPVESRIEAAKEVEQLIEEMLKLQGTKLRDADEALDLLDKGILAVLAHKKRSDKKC